MLASTPKQSLSVPPGRLSVPLGRGACIHAQTRSAAKRCKLMFTSPGGRYNFEESCVTRGYLGNGSSLSNSAASESQSSVFSRVWLIFPAQRNPVDDNALDSFPSLRVVCRQALRVRVRTVGPLGGTFKLGNRSGGINCVSVSLRGPPGGRGNLKPSKIKIASLRLRSGQARCDPPKKLKNPNRYNVMCKHFNRKTLSQYCRNPSFFRMPAAPRLRCSQ